MIARTAEEKKALNQKIIAYKVLGYKQAEIAKLTGITQSYIAENFGESREAKLNKEESEVRKAWAKAEEYWNKLKEKKKITFKGILYDVVQVTDNFLTVCRGQKKYTISKIEVYLSNYSK